MGIKRTIIFGKRILLLAALSFPFAHFSSNCSANYSMLPAPSLRPAKSPSDKIEKMTLPEVSLSTLGRQDLSKAECFLNFDDSPDYLYVEFARGGYAIYLRESMQLLEYSPKSKLKYDSSSPLYYDGPGSYYRKTGEGRFIDIYNNKEILASPEVLSRSARNAQELLRATESISHPVFDYSLPSSGDPILKAPSLYSTDYIHISEKEGTYIEDYQYFLHDPQHGKNTGGSCGAVAAQLLLSFHNYYSDRRIIKDIYLNGGSNEPESNPNLCADPATMNSKVLGTRGIKEDGSDDPNSYFAFVLKKIPYGATESQEKNGLQQILSIRNNELNGALNYKVEMKRGTFGRTVDSTKVHEEIRHGRPAILLMQSHLGGDDHFVVAYGSCRYQYPNSKTSYPGFVTHFGWDTSMLNIWVNAAWCYAYVTLSVDHAHSFVDVKNIGNTGRVESKCTICGFRTDAAIYMTQKQRYVERFHSFPQNGYWHKDYHLRFENAGYKLIQTFGEQDTEIILYQSDGSTEVKKDDDSGYQHNGLIYVNLAEETDYILRISVFLDDYYPGMPFKIAISAVSGDLAPGKTALDNYDNFWTLSGTASQNYGTSLTVGYCKMIVYSPSTSGNYRITLTSSFDNYLYVIDPTSYAPIQNNLDYNDDTFERDASISRHLSSGTKYAILICQYNPQAPFSSANESRISLSLSAA